MKSLIVGLALAVLGMFGPCAHAQLLNFDFSVTNTTGNTPGTITGEIIGLKNNATSSPSNFIITSAPLAFNLTSPASLGSMGLFTVTLGNIAAVNLNEAFSGNWVIVLNASEGVEGTNEIFYNPNGVKALMGGVYVENTLGYPGGISFTLDTTATIPEPSVIGMLAAGMSLLFGRYLVRRTRLSLL